MPDPVVSANIYCAGHLDGLLHHCIAPMWDEWHEHNRAAERDNTRCAYLWMFRYRRRGEHLKLRWHAPASLAADLRERIEHHAGAYFDRLGEAPEGDNPSAENQYSVPIDPEDEGSDPRPDRTLLWTRYQRSPVTFGAEQLMRDDGFSARFTYALGENTARLLRLFRESDDIAARARKNALMKTVISALGAVDWRVKDRANYLVYHRNWLLRYLLLRANQGAARARELLGRFSTNADRLGPGLSAIRQTLAAQWRPTGTADTAGWPQAVARVCSYVDELARDVPVTTIDPFAHHARDVVAFKLLHAAANPLAVKSLDEAFVYHLLLHCYAPDKDRGFEFEPRP